MPEEMQDQLPYLWKLLSAMRIPTIEKPGFEADDIIAYACAHKKYEGWHKHIISSDRDFFQLISEDVVLYRPIQKKLVDKPSLLAEHGIHPNNFALARAVAGDKSDNLPGIPRAGLKTIKNKLNRYSIISY